MPPKKRARKESGLEYECNTLTDEDLRKALLDVGENPGPIDASNRYYWLGGRRDHGSLLTAYALYRSY